VYFIRFGTFDRYILREVAMAWVAVTGVLLVILVSNQVAGVLGQAASGQLPRAIVGAVIVLTSVQNLTLLVPVGMLLAVVMGVGRLYHESEMAAMKACGRGPAALFRPVLLLAVVVAAGLAWLTLDLAPAASARAQELRREALRNAQFGQLEPGKFRAFGGGKSVFYAESISADGRLHHVFVERRVGDTLEVATAETATHEVSEGGALHVVRLWNGERYEGQPGSKAFRRIRFAEHSIPVRVATGAQGAGRREAKTTAQLWSSGEAGDLAEWQWRVSLPLMTLVLALLAVPLAELQPRQGRYGRMGYAIVLYFIYSNLIGVARVWLEKGKTGPWVGVWWVHLLVVALALWLLHRQSPLWRRRVRVSPAPPTAALPPGGGGA
jgi:lipopolysaccharide export system permease protein